MVIRYNISIFRDDHSGTKSHSFRSLHLTLLTAASAIPKNITKEIIERITNGNCLSF